MNKIGKSVLCLLAVCLNAPETYGWRGFAHYRIAREVEGVDPNFAMGPDTFRSVAWQPLPIVVPEFSWSHAVLSIDSDFPVPAIPVYPDDGREPSSVMYELAAKKLSPGTLAAMQDQTVLGADPLEVAKGFLVHNAADSMVHFSHSLGGPTYCYAWPIWWHWETNHQFKEDWANYIVLISKDARQLDEQGLPIESAPICFFDGPGIDQVMGTDDDIESSLTEDTNGNLVLDPGEDQNGNGVLDDYTDDVFSPASLDGRRYLRPYLLQSNVMHFKTNVVLQHLAMKAFRKNRRATKVDAGGNETSDFEVRSTEDISASFLAEVANLVVDPEKELYEQAAVLDLQTMTLGRFRDLNTFGSQVNWASIQNGCSPKWRPSLTMAAFRASVNRAQQWLVQLTE